MTSDVVQLSPDLFRLEPIPVRFVEPDVNHLYKTVRGRYMRETGVLIEIDPPLGVIHPFSPGGTVKLMVRFPHQEDFLNVEGSVSRVLRHGMAPKGREISMVGIRFHNLDFEVVRSLEAYRLAFDPKTNQERSPRIPVGIRVDPSGIDVMASMTAADLSMTGMFVASRAKFPVGKEVWFSFRLPFQKEVVSLSGRVVWKGAKVIPPQTGQTLGFGFQFAEVSPRTRAALATYYARSTVVV